MEIPVSLTTLLILSVFSSADKGLTITLKLVIDPSSSSPPLPMTSLFKPTLTFEGKLGCTCIFLFISDNNYLMINDEYMRSITFNFLGIVHG